ncbi:hypothetical protein [Micromonospora humida]|uniref:Uncharacterized protein n=1 Tax=Micromonospora humida TaxID=2809018 RepID=A0ABS2ITA8_9ACTN|nr:hypothetical protein [Micromonospora humida]MBM7077274.1 hypothetical protein [Micromonospora humida]
MEGLVVATITATVMTTGVTATAMAAVPAGHSDAAASSDPGSRLLADTAPLIRYRGSKKDHMSSVFHPGQGYAPEFVMGQIHSTPQAGTHPLFHALRAPTERLLP